MGRFDELSRSMLDPASIKNGYEGVEIVGPRWGNTNVSERGCAGAQGRGLESQPFGHQGRKGNPENHYEQTSVCKIEQAHREEANKFDHHCQRDQKNRA